MPWTGSIIVIFSSINDEVLSVPMHMMCCRFCAELVMLLEWWSGTDCTLYTDQATVDKFGKEHVIIILNHNFEIDFLCGWTMCERYGILGVSNVAKKTTRYSARHLWLNECSSTSDPALNNQVGLQSWLWEIPASSLKTQTSPPSLEFKSASQTWATEGSSDWLDLVLPRNSLLQTKVGGGPKYSLQRAEQAQRLSWMYVGRYWSDTPRLSVFWHECIRVSVSCL